MIPAQPCAQCCRRRTSSPTARDQRLPQPLDGQTGADRQCFFESCQNRAASACLPCIIRMLFDDLNSALFEKKTLGSRDWIRYREKSANRASVGLRQLRRLRTRFPPFFKKITFGSDRGQI